MKVTYKVLLEGNILWCKTSNYDKLLKECIGLISYNTYYTTDQLTKLESEQLFEIIETELNGQIQFILDEVF